MAWTPYQDALVQEMIALMTEPNWYSQSTITTRLKSIQDQLSQSQTGNDYETKVNDLLSQFNAAKTSATQANEQRYAQLTGGQNVNDANSAASKMLGGYYKPIESAAAKVGTDYGNAYYGAGGIQSGWNSRQTQGTQAANQATFGSNDGRGTGGYVGALGGIATGYGNRENALKGIIGDNYGQSFLNDVQSKYAAERGKMSSDMANRGLANSTVMSSMNAGLTSREARDRASVQDQIAKTKFDALSGLTAQTLQGQNQAAQDAYNARMNAMQANAGLWSDTLGANTQAAGQVASLGQVPLQYQAQTANTANQYLQGLFGTIQNREDVAPSLSDIANLTMQLGRGSANTFALPSLAALSSYGTGTSGTTAKG
jgi:hypothetical protein